MEGVAMIVGGVVQGVGFRYFVLRRATELGLKGYVSNRGNGDVEITAVGDRGVLEEFIKQVKIGPRAAHVARTQIEWRQFEEDFRFFEIR
jgi:acylphosphatase